MSVFGENPIFNISTRAKIKMVAQIPRSSSQEESQALKLQSKYGVASYGVKELTNPVKAELALKENA